MLRRLHSGNNILDIERYSRSEQLSRSPNNPNQQKPCKRERGTVLQVKPLFKRASKKSEQHRNEHGTEGQDENVEKQVEECKECKGYEKREAIPDEALRAGFCRLTETTPPPAGKAEQRRLLN